MAFQQKDLSGVLFKNEEKNSEKSPDYRGDCVIDGQEYRIAAWIKQGKKGKFMSLAFSVNNEKAGTVSHGKKSDAESDVPF